MQYGLPVIRHGIAAFWAMWFTVVFATNLCDGLKSLQMLPQYWMFASGNFAFMQSVTDRYGFPVQLTAVLFSGVVLWEALACATFWRAVLLSLKKSSDACHAIRWAFATGLALWAAFALADEIFITYAVEAAHIRLFIAQLVTLMFLELVHDNRGNSGLGQGPQHDDRRMESTH